MARSRAFAVSLFLAFVIVAGSRSAFAQTASAVNVVVPTLVSFRGTLTDSNGKPLTGITGVTFSLYAEEQGGVPLWLETQNVQPDESGHYSIMLGSSTSQGLPSNLFFSGQARWLGVQAQGQQERPRVMLLSVPYALKAADAETFGGRPPSAYAAASSVETSSTSTASSTAVRSNGLYDQSSPHPLIGGGGTTNFVPLWTSPSNLGDSNIYQKSGFIGIGTTSPNAPLVVIGNSSGPVIVGNSSATTGTSSGVAGTTASSSSGSTGVYGASSGTTGSTYGVKGSTASRKAGAGVLGVATTTTGNSYGVAGVTFGSGSAVYGRAQATEGEVYGVEGVTTSSTGVGVYGDAVPTDTTAQSFGVEGTTPSNGTWSSGVYGRATATDGATNGVFGTSDSSNGTGVYGIATATSGATYGVAGYTASTAQNASGVYGQATPSSGATNGVYGLTDSSDPNADGVYGKATSTTGGGNGVEGITESPNGYGVWGMAASTDTSGTAYGVYGQSTSGDAVHGVFTGINGSGIVGVVNTNGTGSTNGAAGLNRSNSGPSNGVYGTTASPGGVGGIFENSAGGLVLLGRVTASTNLFTVDGSGNGFFAGNLNVAGMLTKGGGSFKIDHPLDPANKYLYHSFVESPDMMNVYNGNITTNKSGLAVVVLPDYFEALNRDFRYQLTVIGQFAQAIVAKEIGNSSFTIKTSKPGVKVSWQVTGIRHDAYADAHRIRVEVEKPDGERGRYLHPELFGTSEAERIGQLR